MTKKRHLTWEEIVNEVSFALANQTIPEGGTLVDPMLKQSVNFEPVMDEDGRPFGGTMQTKGMDIRLQEGPRGHGENRKSANGADIEDLLEAADILLAFYQDAFPNEYNAHALVFVAAARAEMRWRTEDRLYREVEGTMDP